MRSAVRDAAVAVLGALLVGSCSSSGTTTTASQRMSKNAGDNQTAAAGSTVLISPAVKVVDQNYAGVPGVAVTFVVASGGGSVAGATVSTGSDGTATAGSWTLGTAAGTNTLTASASGVSGSPVTFTATGTATPKTITVQAGNNQTATVGTPVAIAPAVKVVDAIGTPIAGAPVYWNVVNGGGAIAGGGSSTSATIPTNAGGISALTSWTLGAVAGSNSLAVSTGVSGVIGDPIAFVATATAAGFNPTSNTSLSGTQTYGSVNIPAGVTVTMSADLTLNVSGAVTIAGAIVGDCKNLTISATGTLTSSGSINNGCSVATTTPPTMTIVATGGYHLTGGTITLGGSLNLTNDASLTDGTFPVAPAPGIRIKPVRASLKQAGVCSVGGVTFTPTPAQLASGADGGQVGANGPDAATWVLQCTGELDINGGVQVRGQNGGPGGKGNDTRATGASATGGLGGKGGTTKVRANNGDLILSGTGNNIQSGDGGAGGSATATATQVGNPGGSAGATGGNGNSPGNIVLQSRNGSINLTDGALTLTMGMAGDGGAATALAADGQTTPVCPAGGGGAATAISGNGGSTLAATLTASGAVGGLANVTVAGGAAGKGGAAKATSGTGGTGSQACKPGAAGGIANATAGAGGNALTRNAAGALIANGGTGGSMEDVVGKGGNGWSDCGTTLETGGAGGIGGTAAGRNGTGGTGLATGTAGAATFTNMANGGNGGDGAGPGSGGSQGLNTANLTVTPTVVNSFVPGVAGNGCFSIQQFFTGFTSGPVPIGNYVQSILDGVGNVVGSITKQLIGANGNNFTAQDAANGGAREGWGDAIGGVESGSILDLTTAVVNSLPFTVTQFTECTINSPNIGPTNPVTITQLDATGNTVGTPTQVTTNNTCTTVPVSSQTKKIKRTGKHGGDANGQRFKGH